MSVILSTSQLSKSFLLAGVPQLIIDELDFSMDDGQFVSIIGPSGCGKSTLLELLAGITLPDKGKILYRGEDITGKSGNLGFMPQDDLLFPWLDVVDNVLLPVRIKGEKIATARARVYELLPVFGLENHASHLPYQLSGGLRQRTAFLRTYMTGADLLLLDEPFAGLDAITRMQMQDWLAFISAELKLSIILVTHDIDEAIKLSDAVHVMCKNPGIIAFSLNVTAEERLNEGAKMKLRNKILEYVKCCV